MSFLFLFCRGRYTAEQRRERPEDEDDGANFGQQGKEEMMMMYCIELAEGHTAHVVPSLQIFLGIFFSLFFFFFSFFKIHLLFSNLFLVVRLQMDLASSIKYFLKKNKILFPWGLCSTSNIFLQ